jgi:hypothetical protein
MLAVNHEKCCGLKYTYKDKSAKVGNAATYIYNCWRQNEIHHVNIEKVAESQIALYYSIWTDK